MSHSYAWIAGSGTYDVAAQWYDVTLGGVASSAPGASDAASIAGGAGAGFILVTGPGSAGSLAFTGNTRLAGAFSATTVTLGGSTPAALDITSGSLAAGSLTVLSGTLQIDGAAASLSISGTLSVAAGAILATLNQANAQLGALVLGGGTLQVDPTATLELGTAGRATSGVLTIDAGATLVSNNGVIDPGVTLAGSLLAASGTTSLFGAITGAGSLAIGAGATMFVGNTMAGSLNIAFAGAAGTLVIYAPGGNVPPVITGFAAGDAIDLSGLIGTELADNPATGTVTLSEAGLAVATLDAPALVGTLIATPDGVDGTLIRLAAGSITTGGQLAAGTTSADHYSWIAPAGGMWNAPANWNDGASPAILAAGTKDIVTIAGPTGNSIALVGGPGNSASLTVTGNVALSGNFATGGLSLGGAAGTGTLMVLAGGTLSTMSPSQINGTLDVMGAAALLTVNGTIAIGAAAAGLPPAAAAVLDGGYLKTHLLYLNAASVTVDASSTLEVGTPGNAAAGALTIDGGYTVTSTGGTIDAAIIDKGTLLASSGVTSLFGAVTGSGVLRIGAGAVLFAPDGIASTATVSFLASTGTLTLYAGVSGFAASIAGFAAGDAIDISGLALTSAIFTATNASKGVLTLATDGQTALTLALTGSYAGRSFQTTPDAVDGTLITLAAGSSGAGALSNGTTAADSYRWIASSGGDWGTASNWADLTTGASPAIIAPGSANLVSIAGPGSGTWLLSGQGRAASLTLAGDLAITGRFAAGPVTAATTSLAVDAGGTLAATSMTVAAGTIDVSGLGALLTMSGTLTLGPTPLGGAPPELLAANQGLMAVGGLVLNGTTLGVDAVSSIEVGTAGGAGAGLLTIDAGAMLTSNGASVDVAVQDSGTLLAVSGVTGLYSDVSGPGTLAIGNGATLFVYGTIDSATTILFAGSSGRLVLNAGTSVVAGTIAGFVSGDEIDLIGASLSGATLNGTILSLTQDGSTLATVIFASPPVTANFQVLPDGVDGSLVRLQNAPCYVAGTRILTPDGERDIATLRPGDRVMTLSGRGPPARAIRWIGRRHIAIATHPDPDHVRPIRIAPGALGPGTPHRALLVSPEHALFLAGALIPAHLLLNGATITRDQRLREVTYLHIELDAHDVVLAEGATAESYLDTGNRGGFANGSVDHRVSADALAIWARDACAPLVLSGPPLAAVRDDLHRQAVALGWRVSCDPDPCLLADGVVYRPKNTQELYRFSIPPAARSVWLLSRVAIPVDDDHRRLGLAVRSIQADGVPQSPGLHDDGWHATEPDWRWTDGNATVSCHGARTIDIHAAPLGRYWTT